ncbi:MAG: hypothetical protein KIT13_10355 [Burkholderiales bacterium]|nr:hypothetical protein [Burkholderiales bacterium]MCW5604928.1 hypothetical protein [Burkholderiales bacterium]
MPIPGTKGRKYLEENLAAVEWQPGAAELVQLSAAFPPGAHSAGRHALSRKTVEGAGDLRMAEPQVVNSRR